MSIGRGFITVEGGLFSNKTHRYEIYRASEFIAYQDFINRITGDGSLKLELANHVVELKGLAPYDELQELTGKLRSLHLLLRSTNIGKGIMQ